MAQYTIYHNTRCSKSRAVHKILTESGCAFDERLYLEDALTEEEIRRIVMLLGMRPIDIVRQGERVWRDCGLTESEPDDEIIQFIATHPIVLERPIIVKNDMEAVIGRPPENVQKLL